MKEQEFDRYLKELNINYNEEQLKTVKKYIEFLKEYNSHTNITAIKNDEDIYLKHFYDSLTLTKAVDLTKYNTLLDIGSGAGFPGLVLKIFYPNLKVTLIDSNNKKTTFLKEALTKLNLDNVIIINDRIENQKKLLNSFDIVTARAVSELRILTEIALPFVKKEGYFIAMKGNVSNELEDSLMTIDLLGGKLENTISFNLPIINAERNLLLISKENNTKNTYPRSYSLIVKKPLKNNSK